MSDPEVSLRVPASPDLAAEAADELCNGTAAERRTVVRADAHKTDFVRMSAPISWG